MKAPDFEYVRARSLSHARELLIEHGEGARLLAGGQSLLPALNMRLMAPDILIDLGDLSELRRLSVDGDHLHIGALVRHADVLASPLAARHAPMMVRALAHVAHAAIRNRGTIGGNLAHADPASELPACMIALDATILASGTGGTRRIAAADFFTGLFTTALAPDEILTGVEIPLATPSDAWHFDELARRSGDYAIVGLCLRLGRAGSAVSDARIVFFSVGDRPTLARRAADALAGQDLTRERIAEACAALSGDLEPQSDLQASANTRLHLARVLLERALTRLSVGAQA